MIETIEWKDINISVKITKLTNITMDFETIEDKDQDTFIKGTIKWDGCSHMYYGDDGYIHLCGAESFYEMIELHRRIFKLASEKIKAWDPNSTGELFVGVSGIEYKRFV